MKITAEKRDILGKKVKALRVEKKIPANVYGPKRSAESVTIMYSDFISLFKKVGYNKFFDLEIPGEGTFKVLIKEIQRHPVKNELLNVSFYQIDESTKLTVDVPVVFVGESPAVKLNLGFLIPQMDEIAVHCLPKDVPASIELDISILTDVGTAITVGDVKLPEGVELDSSMEPSSSIISIQAPQKEEEVVAETPAEGAEGAAPVEGEKAAEGAAKTEEKK